ncbi:MAG TPA: lipoyl(octanoyl) transferase LipB [Burkholderiales bacterium]
MADASNHFARCTSRTWPGSLRRLGLADYASTWRAMREFTDSRSADTPDELWLLEHPPVYTYGVAGRAEHLPRGDTGIPVIKSDRGGQVTYHGPGQSIAYTLIDLRRAGLTVRGLVERLEQAVLDLLQDYGVHGTRREGAPGIYVGGAKVAALGLRIRGGYSYHGLSLNVDLDLGPFAAIDPCGYPGLAVTRLRDLGVVESAAGVGECLLHHLIEQLSRP